MKCRLFGLVTVLVVRSLCAAEPAAHAASGAHRYCVPCRAASRARNSAKNLPCTGHRQGSQSADSAEWRADDHAEGTAAEAREEKPRKRSNADSTLRRNEMHSETGVFRIGSILLRTLYKKVEFLWRPPLARSDGRA